jgi:hypothetical protein
MQSRVDGPTTEDVEALTQLDNLSPQISSCFEYRTGMMAASFVLAVERVARSAGSLERANSNYSEKCLMIAQEAQYHLSGHNPNHYILMNAIVLNFNGFRLANFRAKEAVDGVDEAVFEVHHAQVSARWPLDAGDWQGWHAQAAKPGDVRCGAASVEKPAIAPGTLP